MSEEPQWQNEWEEPAWLFDLITFIFSCSFKIFFRQIQLRGLWRIPREGPVIFVGAPHANQFVDPMMILIAIKENLHRRVSFLIAEKSYKHPIIGGLAKDCRAIPVGRAQDNLKRGTGKVSCDGGVLINGSGTKFTDECTPGMSLSVDGDLTTIASIESNTELTVTKPFRKTPSFDQQSFKIAAKIDNTQMFCKVFDHLAGGHSLGIFPEGGSHDRTTLLPLKPGVAIMALGTMAKNPDVNVTIVPVGMNYFHPHKFRSRAVIEFGEPFHVDPELVKEYQTGGADGKKESVAKLLSRIADALDMVTIQAPDYETLMVVQACQRLYRPSRTIPLALAVEFTRRFVRGYNRFKEEPRIQQLYKNVQAYNERLQMMNITDHQVPVAKVSKSQVFERFFTRLVRLVLCVILCLPGFVLSSPILAATKWYSKRKAAAALKASTVKIAAKDIMATWKVLMGMLWTPLLYMFYSCMIAYYIFNYTAFLNYSFTNFCIVFWVSLLALSGISLATLVVSDIGMDLFRSIVPLYLALNPWMSDSLESLREERARLVVQITDVVNELGPELFPNLHDEIEQLSKAKSSREYAEDPRTDIRGLQSSLDIANDFLDLAKVPIFGNDIHRAQSHVALAGSRVNQIPPKVTGRASFDIRQRLQRTDSSASSH